MSFLLSTRKVCLWVQGVCIWVWGYTSPWTHPLNTPLDTHTPGCTPSRHTHTLDIHTPGHTPLCTHAPWTHPLDTHTHSWTHTPQTPTPNCQLAGSMHPNGMLSCLTYLHKRGKISGTFTLQHDSQSCWIACHQQECSPETVLPMTVEGIFSIPQEVYQAKPGMALLAAL